MSLSEELAQIIAEENAQRQAVRAQELRAARNYNGAIEEMREADEAVYSPPHYRQGDVECIDAIESALTSEEFCGYCKGNALKYIWREKHKGQDESLKKAIWYLNRALGE